MKTKLSLSAYVVCSLIAGLAPAAAADWRTKVDPVLLASAAIRPTDFIIYVTPTADLSGARSLQTKVEKGRWVYEKLKAAAEAAQPPVRQKLSALGVPYQSFWVSNVIAATGNLAVIEAVAALPQVASITRTGTGGLSLPPQLSNSAAKTPAPELDAVIEGSLVSVKADAVWAKGIFGQGVTVASSDSGARWTHAALKSHYRGWNGTTASHDYNWHDGIHNPNSSDCPASSPAPCDDDTLVGGGHGSHTIGTMVGDDGVANRIGMAPQAKWISCRNMNQGVGVPATAYLECMQFFLAPTKIDGSAPDTTKAPDVINNSWGCVEPGCVPEPNPPIPGFLRASLQASRAAGIVYVVSAGNEGNDGIGDCSTLEFPLARYPEAFSVGAINHRTGLVADFSSRGPVMGDPDYPNGLMKPDISAPGVTIRSAQRASDTTYASLSGTSMSGPHVAGLVALVISANPALRGNVDRIEQIIEQTATRKTTDQACGSDTNTSVPNNVYGWGVIDALAAVNMAIADANAACAGPPTGHFLDDFEPAAEPGWSVDTPVNETAPASPAWMQVVDPSAHSATHSFFTATNPSSKDDRLVSPPQRVSATSKLTFWHSYNTESTYDGGVLEVSTDGSTWNEVPGSLIVLGTYDDAINSDFGSAIAGRQAWTGISADYPDMNEVTVDISSFAGPAVRFRWRFVGDDLDVFGTGTTGWNVDDVEFTNLSTVGTPPVANDDTASTPVNAPVAINVLANDTGGGTLHVTAASQGGHGTTSVNPNESITYIPNAGYSGPDTFTYTLSDSGGCTDVGTVTVTVTGTGSPGTLQFSAQTYTQAEDKGSMIIIVTRTGGNAGAASVNYTTSDGTATQPADYATATGTLNWADGDATAKTFVVTINDDASVEPDETVNLTLSSPTGATLGSPAIAVLTITNDDSAANPGTLQFSAATYAQSEAGGAATITVTRTGGSSGAASVNYATSNGTATQPSDYTAATGTLNWGDGDTAAKTFSVSIINDSTVEPDETVSLTLSGAVGAGIGSPASATLTITNDDTAGGTDPAISSISPNSVCQGSGGFMLAVTGTNFTASSVVRVNGSARTTTFVDSAHLQATIPASDLTSAGSLSITVANGSTISNTATLTVSADSAAPTVVAPSSITIAQSMCSGSSGGANGNTSNMLAAYLAGGSATDGCSATQRLAPQANGSDVTSATFFRGGTTAVTFRYRDGAGNIGTATSDVTVRLYGDLDVNANVDSADLVIMANYLVGNVTPGTPPFTAFRSAADLDRDSLVDAVDYVIHANYLVDNITCLPTR